MPSPATRVPEAPLLEIGNRSRARHSVMHPAQQLTSTTGFRVQLREDGARTPPSLALPRLAAAFSSTARRFRVSANALMSSSFVISVSFVRAARFTLLRPGWLRWPARSRCQFPIIVPNARESRPAGFCAGGAGSSDLPPGCLGEYIHAAGVARGCGLERWVRSDRKMSWPWATFAEVGAAGNRRALGVLHVQAAYPTRRWRDAHSPS